MGITKKKIILGILSAAILFLIVFLLSIIQILSSQHHLSGSYYLILSDYGVREIVEIGYKEASLQSDYLEVADGNIRKTYWTDDWILGEDHNDDGSLKRYVLIIHNQKDTIIKDSVYYIDTADRLCTMMKIRGIDTLTCHKYMWR